MLKFWKRSSAIENPNIPLSDPRVLNEIFEISTAAKGSNIPVNRETAMQVPAMWAGVGFLADTIAALPLKVYRKLPNGEREEDDGPLAQALSRAVNPSWSSFRWRSFGMQEALLEGRFLTYIDRDRLRFRPLPTKGLQIREDARGGLLFEVDGRTYRQDDVIDIVWRLGPDGARHLNPVKQHAETLALSIGTTRYASTFFENGGVPPMALTGPIKSSEAAKRAAKDVRSKLKSRSNKNVLVLPDGHELKPVGFDPEKGQLVDSRRMQVEEVARILNLPPSFLQDLTHGTFSNTEQQDLQFVKHTLNQWLRRWEQEINLKLFPDGNRYAEFKVDGLLRGDFATRSDGLSKQITTGQLTPNEARRLENRPPLDGGDRLYIQGAMVPLEEAGEQGNPDAGGEPEDREA